MIDLLKILSLFLFVFVWVSMCVCVCVYVCMYVCFYDVPRKLCNIQHVMRLVIHHLVEVGA